MFILVEGLLVSPQKAQYFEEWGCAHPRAHGDELLRDLVQGLLGGGSRFDILVMFHFVCYLLLRA
jgi:hypothetical protein